MLQTTLPTNPGEISEEFSFWLKLLHILLVLPLMLAWLVPSQLKVDGTFLYFALAAATSYWHVSSVVGPAYAMPKSDCQISITTDLVCCTIITLYMVYTQTGGSIVAAAVAAVAVPLISPAAVLAFHLAFFHLPASHAAFVTTGQKHVAKSLSGGTSAAAAGGKWTNLGLWGDDDDDDDEGDTSPSSGKKKRVRSFQFSI